MKLKSTEFQSSLLSIAEASDGHFHNPYIKYVRFVLCDDQPNENNQGVAHEDFPSIAESAIGTPIKMRFLGQTIGSHIASIPIGHITDVGEEELEDGKHRLIADGILFASDYPDEVEFLEEAFAANKAPGISFEVRYNSALSILKDGVEWIKKGIMQAATFVRNPAYGGRTALLALASDKSITDEDFAAGLTAFAAELRPKNTIEGGNNKVEEELKKAQEALDAAKAQLETVNTELADLKTAHASVTVERDDLQKKVDTQDAALAAVARENLIATRTAAVAEAGIKIETDPEKLTKKQTFWANMEEEAFAEYVDDLKAASKGATNKPFETLKLASASRGVPRLSVESENEGLVGLRERLGTISRTRDSETE